jgi:hypothetical protein
MRLRDIEPGREYALHRGKWTPERVRVIEVGVPAINYAATTLSAAFRGDFRTGVGILVEFIDYALPTQRIVRPQQIARLWDEDESA